MGSPYLHRQLRCNYISLSDRIIIIKSRSLEEQRDNNEVEEKKKNRSIGVFSFRLLQLQNRLYPIALTNPPEPPIKTLNWMKKIKVIKVIKFRSDTQPQVPIHLHPPWSTKPSACSTNKLPLSYVEIKVLRRQYLEKHPRKNCTYTDSHPKTQLTAEY